MDCFIEYLLYFLLPPAVIAADHQIHCEFVASSFSNLFDYCVDCILSCKIKTYIKTISSFCVAYTHIIITHRLCSIHSVIACNPRPHLFFSKQAYDYV